MTDTGSSEVCRVHVGTVFKSIWLKSIQGRLPQGVPLSLCTAPSPEALTKVLGSEASLTHSHPERSTLLVKSSDFILIPKKDPQVAPWDLHGFGGRKPWFTPWFCPSLAE